MIMEYWTFLPVGIVIASVASLLGIGGGIAWMPYLILVVGLEPHKAILISFGIQVIGMGSAVSGYLIQKKIYWRLALTIGPSIVLGILGGAYLSQRIANGGMIQLTLGVFSLILAVFFASQTESYDASLNQEKSVNAPWWLRISSIAMGGISGFLSIGVGDIFIPVVRSKLKVTMKTAVGTALLLNFVVAVSGGLSHFFLIADFPEELLIPFAYAAVGVLIGGQLGSLLSSRIADYRLKELFIFLLLLVGLHMIYRSL